MGISSCPGFTPDRAELANKVLRGYEDNVGGKYLIFVLQTFPSGQYSVLCRQVPLGQVRQRNF